MIQFSPTASDIATQMMGVVKYILGLNIDPAEKRRRLTNSFTTVGDGFFIKMFNDNSELFDSEAIGTLGFQNPEDQISRLSAKLVQNYNLGRKNEIIVREFFDSVLGDAQMEAYRNAISLEKHPTLRRSIVGETCEWCVAMAGTHADPVPEMFARHDNCDCLFEVSGYNSRNGVLTNYKKGRNQ